MGNQPANFHLTLLFVAGLILLLSGLLCSVYVYDEISPSRGYISEELRHERIASSRFILLTLGILFIFLSKGSRLSSKLKTIVNTPAFTNLSLTAIIITLFIGIPELLLRPLTMPMTGIFTRDEHLGWKFRPNTEDIWGGVRVKINGKGLPGPELDYVKKEGVSRILYLGDSVTFGYGLATHDQTFPYQAEALLESSKPDREIETINSGVGGYSSWQQYAFLTREGNKYGPDLVILSFVLNDVIEPLYLNRFGGTTEGWQLLNTASTRLEQFLYKSAILNYTRRLVGIRRFGKDLRAGAAKEEKLHIEYMAQNPDDPKVAKAWQITLDYIDKIYRYCHENAIAVALIVFPYTFQFEDIANLSNPQKTVLRHAAERGVPALDMLPALADRMAAEGMRPSDYFLDADHLSVKGSRVVSEVIVRFIDQHELLDPTTGDVKGQAAN